MAIFRIDCGYQGGGHLFMKQALCWPVSIVVVMCMTGCAGGTQTGAPASPVQNASAEQPTVDLRLLDPLPDLANSAESRDVVLELPVHNIYNTALSATATTADASVATAAIGYGPLSLVVTPTGRGATQVTVQVQSGTHTATRILEFTVDDVGKTISLVAAAPDQTALVITNGSDRDVDVAFEHNGFPTFRSRQEIVDFVQAMPASYVGEPFERKLWRFLVSNVYHWAPLGAGPVWGDPWIELNALGWGFCEEVAAAYVLIAREAGYTSRIWGLSGHIVPEVLIDGRWEMFDPDLVVYYYNQQLLIAGVSELAANPPLILNPINSLHPTWTGYGPYSQVVADIYSSTGDNWVADASFLPTTPPPDGRVWIPAHATLTYPGIWTTAPIGIDGSTPQPVPYYKQARLDLPAGWTGTLPMAWMPWDVQGVGTVEIAGTEYAAGSAELRAVLQKSQTEIGTVTVVNSAGLSVIMMVNALRYTVEGQNTIVVKGVDVWALSGSTIELPAANQVMPVSVLLPGQIKTPINWRGSLDGLQINPLN